VAGIKPDRLENVQSQLPRLAGPDGSADWRPAGVHAPGQHPNHDEWLRDGDHRQQEAGTHQLSSK